MGHEDTYNRKAQAWHYTNATINKLIQEAEQAPEARDRQLAQGVQFGPPRDSLIPPVHSTGTPSQVRSTHEGGRGPNGSPSVMSTGGTGRPGGQGEKPIPKSPLSPDRESPTQERVSVGGTPEYDWDTRYDGIQGFLSCLKNRISEPSTPRGDNHLAGTQNTPQTTEAL